MDPFRRIVVIACLIALLLLQLLMVLAAIDQFRTTQETPAVQQPQNEDPYDLREVDASYKLRKLHMVRPDLIPYPLAIEVYA